MLKTLYYFIVMPGFLFTAVIGLIATWIDRKVSARLQWRQGPPWYQPFADVLKLLGKRTFIPAGRSKWVFMLAPFAAVTAVTIVATMLWIFNANILFIILLLAVPSIALMAGGMTSKNPLSAIGVMREKRLLISYELPFILALSAVIIRSGSNSLGAIVSYQAAHGVNLLSFSGAAAFLASFLVMLAQLGATPFDISDAEQEIESGPLIDYSGRLLAVFKLTKAMMLFVLPMFLITLFLGGLDISSVTGVLMFILKYIVILILIVLVKNTNPRVRIDQAVKFFLLPVTVLSIAGIILAMMGL